MTPMRGYANRRMLNRAGRAGTRPAALVSHTGRRSGRVHVTPVAAWLNGEVVVVSLTFGNQSDWVRNVVAAGRCSIQLDGRAYEATHPEFLTGKQARAFYLPVSSRLERASFRLLGVRQFIRMHAVPAAS
jgi:deazaflavin-dependent oxidoreductase (nitroreductase family)